MTEPLQPIDLDADEAPTTPRKPSTPSTHPAVREQVDRAIHAERARIARELHDSVLGILIGATLSAQRAAVFLPEVEAERLSSAIDELDLVMKAIRHSIYDLRRPGPSFIRHELLDEVDALEQRFDVEIDVDFEGPIEHVTATVTPHLPRVIAEAVTNAVRHGQANRVQIRFEVADGHLRVEAMDDGIGPAQPAADTPGDGSTSGGHGLRNLADRATELGGWSRIEAAPLGGTRLTWHVPVDG